MELGAESETNNINLHIDAVNIKQLKSIKLFCVFLDSELNFSEHISFVCFDSKWYKIISRPYDEI